MDDGVDGSVGVGRLGVRGKQIALHSENGCAKVVDTEAQQGGWLGERAGGGWMGGGCKGANGWGRGSTADLPFLEPWRRSARTARQAQGIWT